MQSNCLALILFAAMLGMAGPAAAQDSQEHSSRKGKDELQWAWFREGAIPLRKVIALPLEQIASDFDSPLRLTCVK